MGDTSGGNSSYHENQQPGKLILSLLDGGRQQPGDQVIRLRRECVPAGSGKR